MSKIICQDKLLTERAYYLALIAQKKGYVDTKEEIFGYSKEVDRIETLLRELPASVLQGNSPTKKGKK